MNGYAEKSVACKQISITRYKLDTLIRKGMVRFIETSKFPANRKTVFVKLSDIEEYLSGVGLKYIKLKNVSEYGVTASAVRYQITQGHLRWIRYGTCLYVCKSDFEVYLSEKAKRVNRERDPMPYPIFA